MLSALTPLILKKLHLYITFISIYNIDSTLEISHSLVVILELSGVSEVQYKEIMIIGDE